MKTKLIPMIGLLLLLTACADDDTATTIPQGDRAEIIEVEFLYLESLPVQVRAVVKGNLPTPCHGVSNTVPSTPVDGKIVVEVTVTPPAEGVVCAQVIEPFEITIDLGSFALGDWTLELNGVDYGFTV